MADTTTAELEWALRARLDAGGRAFVPYVTGGCPGVDADLLRRLGEAGADAIEVGIPFSDPVMDGGVIQEASKRALDAGATPTRVLATIRDAASGVPVAVMTYFNPVLRVGPDAFLAEAANAGVSGVIVPDLPEPGADRLAAIADGSHGFVYCIATYGVTGERERLDATAEALVAALRPLTDRPLLVGVGIGTPEQAAAACRFADGVIVGSALMRHVLAGERDAALDLAAAFRASVPSG